MEIFIRFSIEKKLHTNLIGPFWLPLPLISKTTNWLNFFLKLYPIIIHVQFGVSIKFVVSENLFGSPYSSGLVGKKSIEHKITYTLNHVTITFTS